MDNETLWNNVYSGMDPAYEKPGYGGSGPVEAIAVRYAAQYGLTLDQLDDCFVNYIISKRKEALLNPKALMIKNTYEE